MRRNVFSGTEILLADRRDLGDRHTFAPYEHSFPALRENFLFTRHKIYTSQQKTLLGKRDNISPYEQNKII